MEFLSFITVWVFEFHHNLSFQFHYSVSFWVFYNNLSCWVSSQFEFLSFITVWLFEFHHNLSFLVPSQPEFSSFITIRVLSHFDSFWWKGFFCEIKEDLVTTVITVTTVTFVITGHTLFLEENKVKNKSWNLVLTFTDMGGILSPLCNNDLTQF